MRWYRQKSEGSCLDIYVVALRDGTSFALGPNSLRPREHAIAGGERLDALLKSRSNTPHNDLNSAVICDCLTPLTTTFPLAGDSGEGRRWSRVESSEPGNRARSPLPYRANQVPRQRLCIGVWADALGFLANVQSCPPLAALSVDADRLPRCILTAIGIRDCSTARCCEAAVSVRCQELWLCIQSSVPPRGLLMEAK